MKLYLDTSALVKLYVDEPGSRDVIEAVAEADVVATSVVAYPEARAAFARREREGYLRASEHTRLVKGLDADLDRLILVELRPSVMRLAGRLAAARHLRGFDAIHLASLVTFNDLFGGRTAFLCYDDRLIRAAVGEGFG